MSHLGRRELSDDRLTLIYFPLPDVRVRGMRSHDQRTRSPLHPLEGQAPVLAGFAEVLRQAPLQVHQLTVRKQLTGLVPNACSQLNLLFLRTPCHQLFQEF